MSIFIAPFTLDATARLHRTPPPHEKNAAFIGLTSLTSLTSLTTLTLRRRRA